MAEEIVRGMRSAAEGALHKLMKENKDVYFVTADMGLQFPDIMAELPDQVIDVGIAEQNMVTIAAGLAYSGKICFTSTIATFASLRVAEQIRTDCGYPSMNVNMFGQGRGLAYGFLGATHHAPEDIAVLRGMANVSIVLPADAVTTEKMVVAASKYEGPVYLGMPRGDEPVLYNDDSDIEIGRAMTLTEGNDVTIIACGPMVHLSLAAAKALKKEGIKARVIDMHTIKPLDEHAVRRAAEETGAIVTVEDHNVLGGLGGAVAEVVVESTPVPMKRVGIPDCYCAIGQFEELMEKYNMSTPYIIAAAQEVVKRKK